MVTRLKLGVVGAGRLGGFHADKAAANPEVELIGVYDVDAGRAKEVALKHGVQVFDSPIDLAENVQAAVVAVPTVLHYSIAKELLNKKIHLLVEKPMTVEPSEANELVELAKNHHVSLLAGHTEQFNMAWRSWTDPIRDLFQQGPVLFESRRTSGYTFRSIDIGAVLDLMIHDIELVLSVVPHKITSIEAMGFSTIGGYEDTADARVTFADGSVAKFYVSRVSHQAVRTMKIQGVYENIEIDFGARKTVCHSAALPVRDGCFTPEKPISIPIPTFMQEQFSRTETTYEAFDALALEMSHFVESALHGKISTFLSGERAAKAITVADEILKKMAYCTGEKK